VRFLYFQKILQLTFAYGWMGLLYGSLLGLWPNELGYTPPKAFSIAILLVSTFFLIGWSFFWEMRRHTPNRKYWTIVFLAFLGLGVTSHHPLLSPLFFLLILGAIAYPCKDCIAYTRIPK